MILEARVIGLLQNQCATHRTPGSRPVSSTKSTIAPKMLRMTRTKIFLIDHMFSVMACLLVPERAGVPEAEEHEAHAERDR
jgi:hypothetical protein